MICISLIMSNVEHLFTWSLALKSIHFKVTLKDLALLRIKSTTFSVEGCSPIAGVNHDSLAMAESLLDVESVFRIAVEEIDNY